jgi:hypothetical protein
MSREGAATASASSTEGAAAASGMGRRRSSTGFLLLFPKFFRIFLISELFANGFT